MKTSTTRSVFAFAALVGAGCGCSSAPDQAHVVSVLASFGSGDRSCCLALGPGSLYWIDGSEVGIRALPKAGGESTILASGANDPSTIAVASGRVFWTAHGLWSVPEGGGAPFAVAADFMVSGINTHLAVDEQTIWGAYYDNGARIVHAPAGGGATTTFLSSDDYLEELTSFAVTPSKVVWVTWNFDARVSTLWVLPHTGGTPLAIGTSTSQRGEIVADATHAYWAQTDPRVLQAIPLAGGAPTTLMSGSDVTALALQGSDLYWGDRTRGALMTLPTIGGAPVTLVEDQFSIRDIVIDASRIYWRTSVAASGGMEIRSTEK